MKKLDKLIVGAFVGPFILTFIVVVFILLIQFLLKYIEDIIGKGLGLEVYAELIFYFSVLMVPVALPLAVLLSCLITFGNLGEHHELTAIKGSGVSLIRALAPIFLIVLLLTVAAFFFNNTIAPKASLKAYSLLYDVRTKKASINFKEGVFYEGIPGYRIKISQKMPDGKAVKGIMIYNHTSGRGNTDLIVADSGLITTINNESNLVFELYQGKSYTEYQQNNDPTSDQFLRNKFVKSKMIFSLASFQMNRTKEELFSSNRMMKNVSELNFVADSIRKDFTNAKANLENTISPFYVYLPKQLDSTKRIVKAEENPKIKKLDTLSVQDKEQILSKAVNQARSVKAYITGHVERLKYLKEDANTYEIEKYRKFTQSIACIIMFLIGAPLGAIIRKGGLGIPILVSIVFFIFFYVFSIIGEKWAKEDIVPVLGGVWAANAILLPIGLLFLRQAKNDSKILDLDFYNVLIGKIVKIFKS